jgi:hypothetical protein
VLGIQLPYFVSPLEQSALESRWLMEPKEQDLFGNFKLLRLLAHLHPPMVSLTCSSHALISHIIVPLHCL